MKATALFMLLAATLVAQSITPEEAAKQKQWVEWARRVVAEADADMAKAKEASTSEAAQLRAREEKSRLFWENTMRRYRESQARQEEEQKAAITPGDTAFPVYPNAAYSVNPGVIDMHWPKPQARPQNVNIHVYQDATQMYNLNSNLYNLNQQLQQLNQPIPVIVVQPTWQMQGFGGIKAAGQR